MKIFVVHYRQIHVETTNFFFNQNADKHLCILQTKHLQCDIIYIFRGNPLCTGNWVSEVLCNLVACLIKIKVISLKYFSLKSQRAEDELSTKVKKSELLTRSIFALNEICLKDKIIMIRILETQNFKKFIKNRKFLGNFQF